MAHQIDLYQPVTRRGLQHSSSRSRARDRCTHCTGQGIVEFAMLLTLGILLLLGGIQLALIGQTALAAEHLADQGARYAAINPNLGEGAVRAYLRSIAAQTLPGIPLQVTLAPNPPPRPFGQSLTITVVVSLRGRLIVPPSILGASLPTELTSTATAMSE